MSGETVVLGFAMTWTDEDGELRFGEPWEPEWPEAWAPPEYWFYKRDAES